MKAETCRYLVLLINYILYDKVVLEYKFIYFINEHRKKKTPWFGTFNPLEHTADCETAEPSMLFC
jgi:hypothetical protein